MALATLSVQNAYMDGRTEPPTYSPIADNSNPNRKKEEDN
jgi:hypothetical protein